MTATRGPLSRRRFLKGAGIALALPFLDAMVPCRGRAAAAGTPGGPPRRLVAISNNLGLLADQFFPEDAGQGYRPSPYLEVLKEHRDDFTVFSGVSHPNVDGQHSADVSFLTAAPHPGRGSFRNTISLDQFAAERIGSATRFPSLTLAVNSRTRTLSYNGSGVGIPPEDSAAAVYRQLFFQGTPEQVEAQVRKLDTGESILDAVLSQAHRLRAEVGPRDRARLDQYFTGVRELEARLQASRAWERRPRPRPPAGAAPPVDPESPAAYMEKTRLMYDVVRLALESDSSRAVTLFLNSVDSPVLDIPGADIRNDYHDLSHHGKSEAKLAQLRVIDRMHMQLLGGLLAGLKAVREGGETLLDRTMVLYGSHFGDANTHTTDNMPVLLAGGGFRHGRHLAFSRVQNYPLPNLFVSMLQRLGIEADRFASSTGTMRGLEMT
jgi:hypothetical protein